LAEDIFVDWFKHGAERRVGKNIVGSGFGEFLVEGLEFGIELIFRDAGFGSEDENAALGTRRVKRHGRVDVCLLPCEAGREHADNCVELFVEADGLAEDVAAAEKVMLPKEVAENGDVFDFGFVAGVFCGEDATEERWDAEKLESVGGEVFLGDGFEDVVVGQGDAVVVEEDRGFDGASGGFYFGVFGHGVADVVLLAFGVEETEAADAVGGDIRIWIYEDTQTTLKMAVVAPMPRASERIARMVETRERARRRRA
jgi:hypothetical protein